MALNFEKAQALLAEEIGKSTNGGITNQLLPESLGFIADTYMETLPLNLFGSNLTVSSNGVGSIVFRANAYTAGWTAKTALGGKTPETPAIYESTILWEKPEHLSEALTQYDINRGVTNSLAVKSAGYLKRKMESYFEYILTQVASLDKSPKTIAANSGNLAGIPKVEAEKLWIEVLQFIRTAREWTIAKSGTTKPEKMFISKNDLVIVMSQTLAEALALSGIIGNLAQATFTNGYTTINVLGGYKIIVVDDKHLPDNVELIVGNNQTFYFSYDISAMNTDRILPSNDIQMYMEISKIGGTSDLANVKVLKSVAGSPGPTSTAGTTPAKAPKSTAGSAGPKGKAGKN